MTQWHRIRGPIHSALSDECLERGRCDVEASMFDLGLEFLMVCGALAVMAGICAFEGWSR